MPLRSPIFQRSRRARLLFILALAGFIAAPLILTGAAPQWWTSRNVYQNDPIVASDYSPANMGQLKHFAVTAYDYFYVESGGYGNTTAPQGVGYRLAEKLKQFVEFETIPGREFEIRRVAGKVVPKISPAVADYAIINQGQLKSIASLFYERLDDLYSPYPSPFPRPWAIDNGPSENWATANIGQLKKVFSFDLSLDSDGDSVSDIDEIANGADPYDPLDGGGVGGNPNAPSNLFSAYGIVYH